MIESKADCLQWVLLSTEKIESARQQDTACKLTACHHTVLTASVQARNVLSPQQLKECTQERHIL